MPENVPGWLTRFTPSRRDRASAREDTSVLTTSTPVRLANEDSAERSVPISVRSAAAWSWRQRCGGPPAAGEVAGSLNFIKENAVWLVRIGGVFLMILGLHQLGIFRIPFLYRSTQMSIDGGKPGTVGSSFVIGLTFGAGWSPCMGPILGAILTLAASQQDMARATMLLVVYTLGLAIPFLAAAMAFGSLPKILAKVNKHLHLVTTISGAIMLAVGIIMILGWYEMIFNEIIRISPWTPFEPEI